MRRVDRSSVTVPASLKSGGAGPKELDAARAFQVKKTRKAAKATSATAGKKKARTASFKYLAYKGDDIKLAMDALFHGKCAYCETRYASSMPVDVEHHRPKGSVAEDSAHSGYWWIAMEWDNLLPSCIDCNRQRGQILVTPSDSLVALSASTKPLKKNSGKKDSFPIAITGTRAAAELVDFSAEHPLLLDPCRDDPSLSLGYSIDNGSPAGLMIPVGGNEQRLRGAASIKIYGLNRLELVQDRTRLLRRLEFLGDLVIELSTSIDDLLTPEAIEGLRGTPAESVSSKLKLLRDRTLAEIRSFAADDSPYSTMAAKWIEGFRLRLGSP